MLIIQHSQLPPFVRYFTALADFLEAFGYYCFHASWWEELEHFWVKQLNACIGQHIPVCYLSPVANTRRLRVLHPWRSWFEYISDATLLWKGDSMLKFDLFLRESLTIPNVMPFAYTCTYYWLRVLLFEVSSSRSGWKEAACDWRAAGCAGHRCRYITRCIIDDVLHIKGNTGIVY